MAGAFVASWVHIEVLLVVRLSIPPLACRQNLRADTALPPLLVYLLGDLLGNLLLLFVVVKNSAAILGANIRTLAVLGCGVMHLVEEFEERAVFDLGGIIDDLEGLGVCVMISMLLLALGAILLLNRLYGSCGARRMREMLLTASPPATYSAVPRVLCVAANVSHARIIQSLLAKLAPVHVLDAPEASRSDSRGLCALRHVHRLCGCGGHACKWAEKLCEKGHREVEKKWDKYVEELQFGDSRLGCDLGAIMTE